MLQLYLNTILSAYLQFCVFRNVYSSLLRDAAPDENLKNTSH